MAQADPAETVSGFRPTGFGVFERFIGDLPIDEDDPMRMISKANPYHLLLRFGVATYSHV
jgi:hypothetical protein